MKEKELLDRFYQTRWSGEFIGWLDGKLNKRWVVSDFERDGIIKDAARELLTLVSSDSGKVSLGKHLVSLETKLLSVHLFFGNVNTICCYEALLAMSYVLLDVMNQCKSDDGIEEYERCWMVHSKLLHYLKNAGAWEDVKKIRLIISKRDVISDEDEAETRRTTSILSTSESIYLVHYLGLHEGKVLKSFEWAAFLHLLTGNSVNTLRQKFNKADLLTLGKKVAIEKRWQILINDEREKTK